MSAVQHYFDSFISMHSPTPTAFAGSIPENYDRYLGPLLFEPYALDLVSRIDPRQAQTVLEIACGTGRVTRHLKSTLLPSARLTATDINPDMIAVAKSALNCETITWATADAQALPFPDESFDLVVCQYGLMFVPDKPKAFAEAFRVLKNGGIFLFNTWDNIRHNSFMHTGAEVVAGFFADNPPVFFKTPFSMHDEQELYSLAAAAGFRNVQVRLVKIECSSSNAHDIANGIVKGNPVYNEIRAGGEQDIQKIIDAVAKAIAAKHGDHPVKGSLQAFVCQAEKI
jgi:ubiquinone/menaquinone biosynthesis C-methylase UbiE